MEIGYTTSIHKSKWNVLHLVQEKDWKRVYRLQAQYLYREHNMATAKTDKKLYRLLTENGNNIKIHPQVCTPEANYVHYSEMFNFTNWLFIIIYKSYETHDIKDQICTIFRNLFSKADEYLRT
jgi:hypothetical protein